MTDLAAALAGRYQIERELGAGGMATVFLARDLRHHRQVAIKVLRPELAAAIGADRFLREIRTTATLQHPHILPLFDSGQADSLLYYVMPFVEGESLRDRLNRERQLPMEEAVRWARELADALSYAHQQGIVHRDIKPENILLSRGHALLADFGIARVVSSEGGGLTSTGMAVGTPHYMSPEQAGAEPVVDGRSDLYSLGCVLYEMLAGEPPWTGPTAHAILAKRLSQPPAPLRLTRPQVPAPLEAALFKSLAPVPADRFPDMQSFSAALVASGKAAPARSGTSRKRLLWAGGLAAAAIGVLLLGRKIPSLGGNERTPTSTAGKPRIGVLPFRIHSPRPDDSYFAVGLTEDVSGALAGLSGIELIDRNATRMYADSAGAPAVLHRVMHATAVLQGSITAAGKRFRIRIWLMDPENSSELWNRSFDGSGDDLLSLQSEVAREVTRTLRVHLLSSESSRLARPPTADPDAYDHYLRGLSLGVECADRVLNDSAIAEFGRAVARDSNFAAAWGRLGQKYASRLFCLDEHPRWLTAGRLAVSRALALDSNSAEAWQARASLEWNALAGWSFETALQADRRALAVRPNSPEPRRDLGSTLFHYGFHSEARTLLEESITFDPRDGCGEQIDCFGFARPRLGRIFWYVQQFDSALAVFESLAPAGWLPERAVVLGNLGRHNEGLELLRPQRLNGDIASARALLQAQTGKTAEALSSIRAANEKGGAGSHFHHAQFFIACAYARMGQTREAVQALRATAVNGMPNYPLFRNDPNLQSLKGNAEYEQLLARLKTDWERRRLLIDGTGH